MHFKPSDPALYSLIYHRSPRITKDNKTKFKQKIVCDLKNTIIDLDQCDSCLIKCDRNRFILQLINKNKEKKKDRSKYY